MSRARIRWEIVIVLGLSLGASAVYSVITIIARATAGTALADQTASVNPSRSEREWLDFTNQFLSLFFELFGVALVLYLLWAPGRSAFSRLGLDLRKPRFDLTRGAGLFLAIGLPGIAFYAIGRLIGITVEVQASPLDTYWWTVPILIFSALRAALVEEVIVVGYLFTRLKELHWSPWWIIGAAALLRGSYHLYQGYGPFVGNVVMGLVFGWCYLRWGRVMPLVIAHALLDIASFVGYPLAVSLWPAIFASG
ncbi:CPBP family intramembrane glutamic endopeptidase [Labedella endophytica]|uniref:CPBP family intramembrane metalloprotease n=1 Tax=Labedella endophytica TaxID=1523160 RepID=A0A3S0VEX2_9MICO|nr:CPBP family intramembrane glutamic endopeptidase [Labedella endophytica]RUQ99229.1 CPBP family intramembrane metalloprotease [Labedella endophytica]